MHAGIQLVGREFVLLGLLSALGAAPAALLNRRLDGATRLALAPCFGLAVGLCSMMTLIWRVPANRSYWIVPVLALASITAAVSIGRRDRSERAARRGRWAIDRRSAVQLALVVIVVAGAHDRPLVQLHSTGPVTYAVADAAGYIAAQDGARTKSIHGAKSSGGADATASTGRHRRGILAGVLVELPADWLRRACRRTSTRCLDWAPRRPSLPSLLH